MSGKAMEVAGLVVLGVLAAAVVQRVFAQAATNPANYVGPASPPPSVLAALTAGLGSWGWTSNTGSNGQPGAVLAGRGVNGATGAENLRATGGYFSDSM